MTRYCSQAAVFLPFKLPNVPAPEEGICDEMHKNRAETAAKSDRKPRFEFRIGAPISCLHASVKNRHKWS
jgi:hypothetical protein